jgi:hypothetical protein
LLILAILALLQLRGFAPWGEDSTGDGLRLLAGADFDEQLVDAFVQIDCDGMLGAFEGWAEVALVNVFAVEVDMEGFGGA